MKRVKVRTQTVANIVFVATAVLLALVVIALANQRAEQNTITKRITRIERPSQAELAASVRRALRACIKDQVCASEFAQYAPRGPRGLRGYRGFHGRTGRQGPRGFTGAQGPRGFSIQGPRGFPGIQGPQGLQGLPGAGVTLEQIIAALCAKLPPGLCK